MTNKYIYCTNEKKISLNKRNRSHFQSTSMLTHFINYALEHVQRPDKRGGMKLILILRHAVNK